MQEENMLKGDGRFGLTDLIHGVGGTLAGTVVYPVLATPRIVRRLPKALQTAYKITHRTNKIGPNLKGVIYVALPIGGLLIVPLSPVISALIGSVVGTARGVERANVPMQAWKDVKEIDEKFVSSVIPGLDDYAPDDLEEGERPFDISPLRALGSLLTGLGGALFSMTTSGFTASLRLLPRLHRRTWFSDTNIFEQSMIWTLVSVVWVLTPALGLLGGFGYGLVQGCRFGYTRGTRYAFRHLADDAKKLDEMLDRALEKER